MSVLTVFVSSGAGGGDGGGGGGAQGLKGWVGGGCGGKAKMLTSGKTGDELDKVNQSCTIWIYVV